MGRAERGRGEEKIEKWNSEYRKEEIVRNIGGMRMGNWKWWSRGG